VIFVKSRKKTSLQLLNLAIGIKKGAGGKGKEGNGKEGLILMK